MGVPSEFTEIEFPPFIDLPVDTDWSLGFVAQHIILNQFRRILSFRQPVIDNLDIEAVHQIRVSTRRCRTALQTFKYVWDPTTAQYFQKKLGKLADRFGTARDLDVMILYLEERLVQERDERSEAFEWLLDSNRKLRAAEQPKLEQSLRKFEASGFAQRFAGHFSTTPDDLWELEVVDAG